MTQKEFIEAIIAIYKKARHVALPAGLLTPDKIRRGRNHSVSGLMEDLVAYFLLRNFPTIDKITIDQPLTIRHPGKKTRVIYPDLLLIQKDVIKAVLDIKTDIGRNRKELVNIVVKSSQTIEELRGKVLSYNDGITKQSFEVTGDAHLQGFIVVISKLNINSLLVEKHIAEIEARKQLMHSRLYFLTDGIHPNHAIYRGQLEGIQILPDFELLIKDLKNILQSKPFG